MKLKNIIRSVAPYIAVAAVFVAPTLAMSIGTSMGLTGAAAAAAGSAVIGGTTAALTGGNVVKGAVAGGIGGAVSSGLQNALGSQVVGEFSGGTIDPGVIERTFPNLSPSQTGTLARTLSSAGGSLASQLATGAPLSQALKSAGASGIAGGLSEYLYGSPTSGTGTGADSTDKQLTQMALQRTLSPDTQRVGASTRPDSTVGSATISQSGSATQGPGSQALAQALRTDPGGPLFGSDSEGKQQRVWNVESLKLKDEMGA
jgi:hypothetical protein